MYFLWNFFLEKRAFSYLIAGVLIVAGTICLIAIPKESAPEVEVPIGVVNAVLPGASPSDVESLITNKIEDEVQNIENLDTFTSQSREGFSSVTVQFTASADIDKSIQDLKDAVDRVKPLLPREAEDPMVTQIDFSNQPVLIVSVSADRPVTEFTKLGEDLRDEIKRVPGVSRVDLAGVREREVQVVVRKEVLDRYNLSITQVVSAISSFNTRIPVGSLEVDGVSYALNLKGDIQSSEEIQNIPISTQTGVLYVRDVAFVSDGVEEPTSYARVSVAGEPAEQALTLSVYKKSGGDITKTSDAVKARLDELKSGLLTGSTVLVSFDSGELVQKDLSELSEVGLETVILVMLILFITIGWRESIVAGLSVPLSFLIAFIGLYTSGNSINFVSLFSLILAIGILVDSGIVVTEAIHTRYKKYGDPVEAARASLREYGWPLIAGTMTTVAVFVPLFFISGITGEFISSIPFTIIYVLLASIFVALGLVPLIAILFTKRTMNRLETKQEEWTIKAQTWYKDRLRRVLESRRIQRWFIWSLVGAFALSLALPAIGVVKFVFFPPGDEDFIYINLEKPNGTSLEQTDLATRAVEEMLYEDPRVASFTTTVGSGSVFSEGSSGASLANMTINLKEDRKETSGEIVEDLRKKLSSIKTIDISVLQAEGGPPTGAPVSITLLGDNLSELESAAGLVQTLLSEISGTTEVDSTVGDVASEFVMTLDKAKAAQWGLSTVEIAGALRVAVNGTIATTIRDEGTDIDIRVKSNLNPDFQVPEESSNATPDTLRQLSIETPKGPVLLGSLVDIRLERANAIVRHEDGKRIANVTSYLKPGVTAADIQKIFETRQGELNLPASVEIKFGGENEDVNNSIRDMFFALVGGMLLMLAILVLEFNSFRHTFYLLSIVPLSLIGVLGGLAIVQQPLSFPSMLGFIALAGVIINHAIILLDSIHRYITTPGQASLLDGVIEASASRLRPIVLTTATTVIGMIPLAGASALWGPLAFSIMFGLAFAMILTLVLVPVLFYRNPGKEFKKS